MLLRHRSDYRTLLWAFVLTPGVVAMAFVRPDWAPYLCPLACYFTMSCGVMAHNHNHSPTFRNRRLNDWFSRWISIFYGYPTFAWIPTHNLNHHKFVNKAGDATITWRFTEKHNSLVALSYFFVSAYYQSGPISEYVRKARTKRPAIFRRVVSQYLCVVGGHASMAALAVYLYGPSAGLKLWVLAMGIPSFFSLWALMYINYIQHVHTDPWSEHNHSRNFVSKTLNFLLFNNGYHTIHHEHPGSHWSIAPQLHKKIEAQIDPRLNVPNFIWFVTKQYLLAPFFPQLGTQQVGRRPNDPPGGELGSLATESIEAEEIGTNAAIS